MVPTKVDTTEIEIKTKLISICTKTFNLVKCLIRKVQVLGLPFLKIKEPTFVNNCFQKGCKEEIGLFGQGFIRLARKLHILTVSLGRKLREQGLVFMKIKELTFVNDCFQKKHNAVIGVFLQRLIIGQVYT